MRLGDGWRTASFGDTLNNNTCSFFLSLSSLSVLRRAVANGLGYMMRKNSPGQPPAPEELLTTRQDRQVR